MITEINFNGPEGRIEGRYKAGPTPDAPVALILHPDSKQGGTMNDKITFHLFKTFANRGFSVLRFNFRGVGKSEGRYTGGEGELADAAAAMDWLQFQHNLASGYWVAGFSFGAWIGMQLLMRRPELDGFISLSLPTKSHDFNFLAPCPVSGMIIHGANDHLVPQTHTDALVEKLNAQKGIEIQYRVLSGADHNLTGYLPLVLSEADEYIRLRQENVYKRRTA